MVHIMKMTVDANMMKETFENWDRDYYTIEALEAIDEFYNEIDENIEFDVIGICCEWNEYGETPCLKWSDFVSDYSWLLDRKTWMDENALEEYDEDLYVDALIEALEERTTVTRLSNSVLVMVF